MKPNHPSKTDPRLFAVALCLIAALVISACGSSSTPSGTADKPAPAGTTQAAPVQTEPAATEPESTSFADTLPDPREFYGAADAAPASYVGTWISVNSGLRLVINADGSAQSGDLPAFLEKKDGADDADRYIYGEVWNYTDNPNAALRRRGVLDDLTGGYYVDSANARIQGEYLSLYSGTKGIPSGLYYREGSENPAEGLYGNWVCFTDPEYSLTIQNDGTSALNGDPVRITAKKPESTDSFSIYRSCSDGFTASGDIILFADKNYIQYFDAEMPYPVLMFPEEYENPFEKMIGTWEMIPVDGIENAPDYREFTVTEDHRLLLNGQEGVDPEYKVYPQNKNGSIYFILIYHDLSVTITVSDTGDGTPFVNSREEFRYQKK